LAQRSPFRIRDSQIILMVFLMVFFDHRLLS
jgi:hypothetical protein